MKRMLFALAVCALVFQTGCITLFSKTEVVRSEEQRRPVTFENQEAAETFQTSAKSRCREMGGSYVGVPFVTLYSKQQKLSEVANWNDSVAKCDTDQDGVITQVEATMFSKWPND